MMIDVNPLFWVVYLIYKTHKEQSFDREEYMSSQLEERESISWEDF